MGMESQLNAYGEQRLLHGLISLTESELPFQTGPMGPQLEPWLLPLQQLIAEGEVSWAEVVWASHIAPQWNTEAFLWLMLCRSAREGHTALRWSSLFPQGVLHRCSPPLFQLWKRLHSLAQAPEHELGWRQWAAAHAQQGDGARGWINLETGFGLAHFWPFEKRLMEALSLSTQKAKGFQPLPLEASVEAQLLHFLERFPLAFLCGGPGTGKSTLVARCIELWLQGDSACPSGLQLVAPTARAVQRLFACLQQHAKGALWPQQLPEPCTVHRLLQHRRGLRPFQEDKSGLPVQWLIVDEASMLDSELLCELWMRLPSNARMLLVGDGEQLPSIEPGGWLQHVYASHLQQGGKPHRHLSQGFQIFLKSPAPMAYLTQTHRFQEASLMGSAVKAVQRGAAAELDALWELRDASWRAVELSSPKEVLDGLREGYKPFLEAIQSGSASFETLYEGFHQFRWLTFGHHGPYGTRAFNGFLLRCISIPTPASELPLFKGIPLMVNKNLPYLDLANGEVGLLWPASEALKSELQGAEGSPLQAWSLRFLKWKGVTEVPLRLLDESHLDLALVSTVHKAQGSEFKEVALLVPPDQPMLSRAWLYTGMTRAQSRLTLVAERRTLASVLAQKGGGEHFFF